MKPIYQNRHNTKIDPALLGVWRQEGYGRVLAVDPDGSTLYHDTPSLCYPDPHEADYLSTAYSFFKTDPQGRRLALYRFDYGDKTDEYPNRDDFVRLDRLPAACVQSLEGDEYRDAVFVFDLVWEIFERYYPFFARRGVDWSAAYSRFRPRAAAVADADALFDLVAEMLAAVNDGHIYFSRGERRFHAGTARLLGRLRTAFEKQDEVPAFGDFTWKWYSGILEGIEDGVVAGQVRKALNDRLRWGAINEDIGYLFLTHLTGFGPPEATKPEQLALLDEALDEALEELGGKKALILDLSHNQGGFEAAGHLIAERFADTRRHVLDEYTAATGPGRARSHYVAPSGRRRFTGPLYVLSSEVTVSAGEVLLLRLKAFPQVKHAGSTTRGYLSSILNKPLPDGFHVTLSNEYWVGPDGRVCEGEGIQAEVPIDVFPDDGLFGGHRRAVGELVECIGRDLGLR